MPVRNKNKMKAAADFAYQKDQLENTWRIGEELGIPTPEDVKIYDIVRLEIGFLTQIEVAMNVASLARQWIETRNPFCIDRAVVACFTAGIEPSESLQKIIAEVAQLRLDGKIRSGTPKKLEVESHKQATLFLIANLIHSGETLNSACSKAAAWHKNKFQNKIKSSTLEKYYVKAWRTIGKNFKTGIETKITKEKLYFHGRRDGQGNIISRGWDNLKSDEEKRRWKEFAASMPDVDPNLRGSRR